MTPQRIQAPPRAFRRGGAPRRALICALICALAGLGGCQTAQAPRRIEPVRAGLLLPLSAPQEQWRATARAMLEAAQLALFDQGETPVILLPQDTGGTAQGAARAMQAVLAQGAEVVLGPVLSAGLRESAQLARARNVPVIAFSPDRRNRQAGLYLFGFAPEEEVERVLDYAATRNVRRIAALIPDSDYGRRLRAVLVERTTRNGTEIHAIETYRPSVKAALAPARRLAEYAARQKELEAERRRLRRRVERAQTALAQGGFGPQAPATHRPARRGRSGPDAPLPAAQDRQTYTVLNREQIAALLKALEEARAARAAALPEDQLKAAQEALEKLRQFETYGEIPYDAVFLPEGGARLRGIAQLLPFFDVGARDVRFLGTGLWDDPSLSRELPLNGGWFAAPPPEDVLRFQARFRQAFGSDAPRLASLAYDAVSLIAAIVRGGGGRFEERTLLRPEGFRGLDGLFRFRPDGVAERALAVMEIERRGRKVIAAPLARFPDAAPVIRQAEAQFRRQRPEGQRPEAGAEPSPEPAAPARSPEDDPDRDAKSPPQPDRQ